MGVQLKRRQMAEQYVLALYHSLNHGEALPPIRTMVEESGLGRSLIEKAIQDLVQRGLLESRERSGIYRTMMEQKDVPMERIVDVVACSEIDYMSDSRSFIPVLVSKLVAYGTTLHYAMRVHRVNYFARLSAYEQLIDKQNLQKAFLLVPHTEEIVRIFRDRQVGNVVLLPRYYPSQGPAVIDPPNLVERQLKYLMEQGHRRIAYIHAVDLGFPSLFALLWRESYYRMMAENQLPVCPGWVVHHSFEEKVMFKRLDGLFSTTPPPTAVVCHESSLVALYHYCAMRRLRVGQDISLVSTEGLVSDGLYPQPTVVVQSTTATVEMAWNFLLEAGDQKFNPINYIDLTVREGSSVIKKPKKEDARVFAEVFS
ncbi:substrate-binding domain-containing protein [Victivallis sp. Marseille-Q1083]|uniref:substrate-binding domain-containing protein n=1 Tax=Victivallis sp. Marseille-Q1083 TaxID=2717288 RepID=UPI001589AF29|nr:substrate-binding domain-containing protein [Victivallis sp. Marseille-Q1083]